MHWLDLINAFRSAHYDLCIAALSHSNLQLTQLVTEEVSRRTTDESNYGRIAQSADAWCMVVAEKDEDVSCRTLTPQTGTSYRCSECVPHSTFAMA